MGAAVKLILWFVLAATDDASWQTAPTSAAGGICMVAGISATGACAQQGITAPVSASLLSSMKTISTS